MPTTEPIRDLEQLRQLANYFLTQGQYRNHVMVVLGVHSVLRIGDLLSLQWSDLYDFRKGSFKKRFSLIESKTKKRKTITLHPDAIWALQNLFDHRKNLDSPYVFSNGHRRDAPINRVQAWRIITTAAKFLHIEGVISCHSLRKTFGYHAAVEEDIPPALLMEIYNHSDFKTTQMYLGLRQDELDGAYLGVKLF